MKVGSAGEPGRLGFDGGGGERGGEGVRWAVREGVRRSGSEVVKEAVQGGMRAKTAKGRRGSVLVTKDKQVRKGSIKL